MRRADAKPSQLLSSIRKLHHHAFTVHKTRHFCKQTKTPKSLEIALRGKQGETFAQVACSSCKPHEQVMRGSLIVSHDKTSETFLECNDLRNNINYKIFLTPIHEELGCEKSSVVASLSISFFHQKQESETF